MTANGVAEGARALGLAPDPRQRSHARIAPSDGEVARLLRVETPTRPLDLDLACAALANVVDFGATAGGCASAEIRGEQPRPN